MPRHCDEPDSTVNRPHPATVVAARRRETTRWRPPGRAIVASMLVACVALATIAPAAFGAPKGEEPPKLDETQERELRFLLDMVAEAKLDMDKRREAARTLLDRNLPVADQALAKLLTDSEEPGTQQAIAQALAGRPEPAPVVFADPLLALLESAKSPLLEDVASALGRVDSEDILTKLIKLASQNGGDDRVEARRGAILTLGHLRSKRAAEALMKLIEPRQPEAVQHAAYASLAALTGIREYERDANKWRRWWQRHRRVSDAQWYAVLIEHLSRRNNELTEQRKKLQERLIKAQRSTYLATPPEKRHEVIVELLADPLSASRRLAIELAGQMLLSPKGVAPEVRKALVAHIDDSDATVRAGAVRLLKDLETVDAQASEKIVAQLTGGKEDNTEVNAALLMFLARWPQARGIDPALGMLADEALGEHAAAAIVRAYDEKLLSKEQLAEAATLVRKRMSDNPSPAPRFIELTGRVGNDEDWKRIEAWLAHQNDAVKEAAARAWARSDRPLMALARRAADPVIQPILYPTASRRARTVETFQLIVSTRPEAEQLVGAWRDAIARMSSRVDPKAVIEAAEELSAAGDAALARDMLSAAISRLRPNGNGIDKLSDSDRAALAGLLVARGEALLASGDPKSATVDAQSAASIVREPSTQHQRQRDLLQLGIALAMGDMNQAQTLAKSQLEAGKDLAGDPVATEVAQRYLRAATRAAQSKHPERAAEMLNAMAKLLGDRLPAAVKTKADALRKSLQPPDKTNGAEGWSAGTGEGSDAKPANSSTPADKGDDKSGNPATGTPSR